MGQRLVLLVGLLFVALQGAVGLGFHGFGVQVEILRQTLAQHANTLKSIVLIRVVLKQK